MSAGPGKRDPNDQTLNLDQPEESAAAAPPDQTIMHEAPVKAKRPARPIDNSATIATPGEEVDNSATFGAVEEEADTAATIGPEPKPKPRFDATIAVPSEQDEAPASDATIGAEEGAAGGPGAEEIPEELRNHGTYQITRLVGQGGMGVVYLAEHRMMDRTVALKVIHRRFTANAQAVDRFRREVKAAAKLHHPNIVTAFDAGSIGHAHFLVMEFVDGRSLADYLREHGRLPVEEACEYARQAALGLQHAHENGMVHRDIKPDNLMRTRDGHVKILDFGLARIAAVGLHELADSFSDVEEELTSSQLTAAGSLMGTPDYIAPEQVKDSHAADIRADIYALGCTLYQMLTGQVPYPGGKPLEKLGRHAKENPTPIRKLRPGLPEQLGAVLRKMMAKDLALRYQTPADVARALEPFAQPEELVGSVPRRWPLPLAALVGVAMLLAFPVAYWWLDPFARTIAMYEGRQPLPVPEATELAGRESPFDALAKKPFPKPVIDNLGGGDAARLPKQLVAVLGDPGFSHGHCGYPAFSPDGKHVACPSDDDVRIFEVATGKLVQTLTGYPVTLQLAYSPDGKRLAGVGHHHKVVIWDVETGKELLADFFPASQTTWGIAYSPDGKAILATSTEGQPKLWDVETRRATFLRTPPRRAELFGAAFHPQSKLFAVGSGAGEVWLYRAPELAPLVLEHPFNDNDPGRKRKMASGHVVVAFSPDGQLLATGSDDLLKLWRLAEDGTAKEIWTKVTPAAGLLGFSGDSQVVFSSRHVYEEDIGQDHIVRRWNAQNGARLGDIPTLSRGGYACYVLSADGKVFAGGNVVDDTRLSIYDAKKGGLTNAPSQGHTGQVECLAVAADGKFYSGGQDGMVREWDAATGKEVRAFRAHNGRVRALALHPSGKALATAGADNTAFVWDLELNNPRFRTPAHGDSVEDVAFSRDGKLLATACKDGGIYVWDAEDGQRRAQLTPNIPAQAKALAAICFDPQSDRVLAAGADGRVHHASLAEGASVHAWHPGTAADPLPVASLTALPDGLTFASVGTDAQVRLWSWETGKVYATLPGLAQLGQTVRARADGLLLAAAGKDRYLRLWDLSVTPPAAHRLRLTGTAPTRALAFSPEGRYLLAGNADGTIFVYRLAERGQPARFEEEDGLTLINQFEGHTQRWVHAVGTLPKSTTVVSAGHDQKVLFWDPETAKEVRPPLRLGGPAITLATSPDGDLLWTTTERGDLRRWVLATGESRIVDNGGGRIMRGLAVAGNGSVLIGGSDGAVSLWNAEGTKKQLLGRHATEVLHVDITSDRQWAASSSSDGKVGTINIWDVPGVKLHRTFPTSPHFNAVAFSPDGKRLAWGDKGQAVLYDVAAGQLLEPLRGPSDDAARTILFSPSGRYLVTGGMHQGNLLLYDTKTGALIDQLRTAPIISARFSSDSRRLYTAHEDTRVRVWRLPKSIADAKQ